MHRCFVAADLGPDEMAPYFGSDALWDKPGHFETSKIHFLTSEGVSAAEGASKASSPEQANE